jgi:hypothetical protein
MNYLVLLTALLASVASGFSPAARSSARVGAGVATTFTPSSTSLYMASEEDLLRWSKSKRQPDADDTVVELMRPLGLVLQEDENGNVFVETLAPKGNAARTGLVRLTQNQYGCGYRKRIEIAVGMLSYRTVLTADLS